MVSIIVLAIGFPVIAALKRVFRQRAPYVKIGVRGTLGGKARRGTAR